MNLPIKRDSRIKIFHIPRYDRNKFRACFIFGETEEGLGDFLKLISQIAIDEDLGDYTVIKKGLGSIKEKLEEHYRYHRYNLEKHVSVFVRMHQSVLVKFVFEYCFSSEPEDF